EDECLEGNYCVEGTCLPEEEACSVCDDDQICEYEANRLTVHCEFSACEAGEKSCDGDILQVCKSDGSGFDLITCHDGCNEDTVTCNLPEGDRCETPLEVEVGESIE